MGALKIESESSGDHRARDNKSKTDGLSVPFWSRSAFVPASFAEHFSCGVSVKKNEVPKIQLKTFPTMQDVLVSQTLRGREVEPDPCFALRECLHRL